MSGNNKPRINREDMHLRPAEYVIRVFKGVRATARAIGRNPSSVSKWQKERENRGTSGQIPHAVQRTILEQARERGLDITAEDLILGREVVVE